MPAKRTAKKPSKWLLGCGIGCTALVMIALGLMGGGLYYFSQLGGGVDKAIEIRGTLTERHGDPEAYAPAPDGALPAERLETFVQVRQALLPMCPRFEGSFGRLDEMDEQEDISSRELFGVFRSIMGIVPLISEFYQARNQALLDAGMGLGEYTYLYVLAYHAGEGAHPEYDVGRRVRGDFIRYLKAQAEAGASPEFPDVTPYREALAAEIAALESDERRVPWEDGLPEVLAASLEPYREALDDTACRAADEMALSVTERGGLTIQSR
jgi:hypothetical protein